MARQLGLIGLIVSCLVCLGSPALAGPGPRPVIPRVETVTTGEVRGVVTGAEDGLELRRVRLVLRQDASRKVVSIEHTDQGGEFVFDDLAAGVYSLEAQAAGYFRTIVAPVVIRTGKARIEHITLTPLGDARRDS